MVRLKQIKIDTNSQLRVRLTFVVLILIPALWVSAIWCLYLYMFAAEHYPAQANMSMVELDWTSYISYRDLTLFPGSVSRYSIAGYDLVSDDLPSFISIDDDTFELVAQPQKYDVGDYKVVLRPVPVAGAEPEAHVVREVWELHIRLPDADLDALQNDTLSILGDRR